MNHINNNHPERNQMCLIVIMWYYLNYVLSPQKSAIMSADYRHFPIYLVFPNNFRFATMLRDYVTKCVKWNIFICLFTYIIYLHIYCFYFRFSSCFIGSLFLSYSGDLGGMFCSLPLRLAPRCGENCLPVFRPLWCSRIFCPAPPNLTWPLAPLKERNGWRGGRLSPDFDGLSVVRLELGRGSSTLLTLSSCRGWLAEEAGGEGGVCAGGGSFASLWHTSA